MPFQIELYDGIFRIGTAQFSGDNLPGIVALSDGRVFSAGSDRLYYKLQVPIVALDRPAPMDSQAFQVNEQVEWTTLTGTLIGKIIGFADGAAAVCLPDGSVVIVPLQHLRRFVITINGSSDGIDFSRPFDPSLHPPVVMADQIGSTGSNALPTGSGDGETLIEQDIRIHNMDKQARN